MEENENIIGKKKEVAMRKRITAFLTLIICMIMMFPYPVHAVETDDVFYIHVGAKQLTVKTADTTAAKELMTMLEEKDLIISMTGNSFEQYGSLGRSLTAKDSQITAQAGDVLLYNSNTVCVFYGSNSYSYTRIGKIQNTSKQELQTLLSGGNLSMTFSKSEGSETPDVTTEIRSEALSLTGEDEAIEGILYRPDTNQETYPTVILAHGFGGNYSYITGNLARELAKNGYAAYAFNFRNPDTRSMLNTSVLTEAATLNNVIDRLKAYSWVDTNNLYLLGESQGGFVASYVAAKREENPAQQDIKKLVLYYPAFVLQDDAKSRNPGYQDPDYVWAETETIMGNQVSGMYSRDALSFDIYEVIAGYKKDVLIVHGTADSVVPLSYSERAAATYENATLKTIDGAGHGFYSGTPFTTAVQYTLDFLGGKAGNQGDDGMSDDDEQEQPEEPDENGEESWETESKEIRLLKGQKYSLPTPSLVCADTAVAAADAKLRLSGKAAGKTTLTVSLDGAKDIVYEVEVTSGGKASVDAAAKKIRVPKGKKLSLTSYFTYAVTEAKNGNQQTVSGKKISSVLTVGKSTGILKAAGSGSATVALTGLMEKSWEVLIDAPSLSTKSLSLSMAQTGELSMKGLDRTGLPVLWQSENPNIVTITEKGIVSPVSAGSTKIYAQVNEKVFSCTVKVIPKKGELSCKDLVLAKGATKTVSVKGTAAKKIQWVSSDPNIVTVKNGKLNAVKAGNATITATLKNQNSDQTAYTLNVRAVELPTQPTTVTVGVGQLADLPLDYGVVDLVDTLKHPFWKSAKPSIAGVCGDGVIQGAKAGRTSVTANVFGKKVKINIVVTKTPVEAGLHQHTFVLAENQKDIEYCTVCGQWQYTEE